MVEGLAASREMEGPRERRGGIEDREGGKGEQGACRRGSMRDAGQTGLVSLPLMTPPKPTIGLAPLASNC